MKLLGSCHNFARNSSFTSFRCLRFMSLILTCLENTKLRARLKWNIYKIVTHQIMRVSQNVRQITFIIFDEGGSKCHTNDESKTYNSSYEKRVFPWIFAGWVSRIWTNTKWTEEKMCINYKIISCSDLKDIFTRWAAGLYLMKYQNTLLVGGPYWYCRQLSNQISTENLKFCHSNVSV